MSAQIRIEKGQVSGGGRSKPESRSDALERARARSRAAGGRQKSGTPIWPMLVVGLWVVVIIVAIAVAHNRRAAKRSRMQASSTHTRSRSDDGWVAPREAALGGKTFAEAELEARADNDMYQTRKSMKRQYQRGR